MKHLLICVLSSWTLSAAAQTAPTPATPATDHSAHHPAANAEQKTNPMAAMDQQIKAMEQMHEKLLKAKTPQERQALMAEHRKLLQESMAMMNTMRGEGMGGMGGMGMGGMGGMGGGNAASAGTESKPGGMCGAGGGCPMMGGGPMEQRQQMMEKRMEMMRSMMQMMMDTAPAPAAQPGK